MFNWNSLFFALLTLAGTFGDLSRRRRLSTTDPEKLWPFGIVPYKFSDGLSASAIDEIQAAMSVYESNTPIRFVDMTSRVMQSLGHKTYATFIDGGRSCRSFVGRYNPDGSQDISCCKKDTCIHELGHLLGFQHEMTHPDRSKWIRMNWKTIYRGIEAPYFEEPAEMMNFAPYDLSSYMHYYRYLTYRSGPRFDVKIPELPITRKHFYMFRELCDNYNCKEFDQCKGKDHTCYNEGYISVVDNKCSCICLDGFDPTTRCKSLLEKVSTGCGGYVKLSNSMRTAVIKPERFDTSNIECLWIVQGPDAKGSLVLNFKKFNNIRQTGDKCIDSIAVNYARLGQTAVKYCGSPLKHSVRSVYNNMTIYLKTGDNSKASFEAEVTWTPASDWCYKFQDAGLSYGGQVNYTRGFKSCLSWKVAAACYHTPYTGSTPFPVLEGNYCRNPDNSLRPWCYTDKNGCKREYCDVCGLEDKYDQTDNCYELKARGECSRDKNVTVNKCARTCSSELTSSTTATGCSRPSSIQGSTIVNNTSFYKVGDIVTYNCQTNKHYSIQRICLSTGEWTVAKTACTECPVGFTYYKGNCYRYIKTWMNFKNSVAECKRIGADFLNINDAKENNFIFKLRPRRNAHIWLGCEYDRDNQQFRFGDGTRAGWWAISLWTKRPYPSLDVPQGACFVQSTSGGRWVFDTTFKTLPFVCKMPANANPVCIDVIENCSKLVNNKNKAKVCSSSAKMRNLCRRTCGLCQ